MDRLLIKLKRVESLLGELLRYFKKLDQADNRTKELTNFTLRTNKAFLRKYHSKTGDKESRRGFG